MTVGLQVGSRLVTAEDLFPLLIRYQMLPKLIQELVIDEAIASVEIDAEEAAKACQAFYEQNGIVADDARQGWLKQQGMSEAQLEWIATRNLRVEAFKQMTWNPKLESYFLKRKGQLDRVIYSLIRTKDAGIARELYFRILEGEQAFADAAREYSQGVEAQTNGLIGPVELSVPHPALAQILSTSKPGELAPPTSVGEWIVLVRLERFMPAQLDDAMRSRLLDECFNLWLKEQVAQVDLTTLMPTAATPVTP
jgi:parvulin-like peptidyl-prolyl isomerase